MVMKVQSPKGTPVQPFLVKRFSFSRLTQVIMLKNYYSKGFIFEVNDKEMHLTDYYTFRENWDAFQ